MTADHWPTCCGEGVATVTEMRVLVVMLPLKSLATAARLCVPRLAVEESHCTVYGELCTSLPRFTPSNRNCTPATPTLSEAAADTPVIPTTVAPSNGEVIETAGGVVSGGAPEPIGVFISTWISACDRA